MTTTLSAQQAKETKIFVINWDNKPEPIVEETTLFEHVCESAEETTSPRGIEHKLFIREVTGGIYQLDNSDKLIDQKEYDSLAGSVQEDYTYWGEGPIAFELCEWVSGGKVRIIDTYDNEEVANDELYTRTYNYDFMPDDQRDTSFYSTEEEAEAALEERLKDK
jgi:hypothetical protein